MAGDVTRLCLKCRKLFASPLSPAINRICDRCKPKGTQRKQAVTNRGYRRAGRMQRDI